jgi:REP element-mobilizing transposase RayT
MAKFRGKYRIESARLKTWDYRWAGWYFITIVTYDRRWFFGRIKNGEMIYSPIGEIADRFWREIPDHFLHVEIDTHAVMPNHVHGIIHIVKSEPPVVKSNTIAVPGSPRGSADGSPDGFVDGSTVETQSFASLRDTENHGKQRINPDIPKNQFGPQSRNLASIMRGYKIGVTKWCRIQAMDFDWQDRFHDHIIRNARELFRIRQYIKNNPKQWEDDEQNNQPS